MISLKLKQFRVLSRFALHNKKGDILGSSVAPCGGKRCLSGERSKQIFTLVELIVILAIMAIMTMLLIEAMHYGMNQVKDNECKTNIRDISIATMEFGSDNQNDLPEGAYPGNITDLKYWVVDLAPYLGYANIRYPQVEPNVSFWMKKECKGLEQSGRYAVPDVLKCPFRPEDGFISYSWNTRGIRGRYEGAKWKRCKFGRVFRYHSNIYEVARPESQMMGGDNSNIKRAGSASKSGHYTDSGSQIDYFSKRHIKHGEPGGNYLFMDGHLEWKPLSFLLSPDSQYNFWFTTN